MDEISIYLDTQHVSRAAAGLNQIPDLLNDPRYCFVFSATHVVESLPKDVNENDSAIKRLAVISSHRSKNLVSWGSVSEIEQRHGRCELDDFLCSRHEMLFPQFAMHRAAWEKAAVEELKTMFVEMVPDANVRRSLQAAVIKRGRLTPQAFQMLRARQTETSKQLDGELPQLVSLLELLYDFLEGRVTENVFLVRFQDALASPVALAQLSRHPQLSSILDFSKFFWTYSNRLEGILSQLATGLVGVQQFCEGSLDYSRIRRMMASRLQSTRFRSLMARSFVGLEVSDKQLQEMAGTRAFIDVFSMFVLEKMDRFANDKSVDFGRALQVKRSDTADLSHVFYFPYVDLFGCDRAMRDRIKKAGWPTTKVFTTDQELARLIRHENESRQSI